VVPARGSNMHAHFTAENGDVLTSRFHDQKGGDAQLGIIAKLYRVTDPVLAHCHDFLELAFALKGNGHHEDEQRRLPLLAGDVWIVQPSQWHAYPVVGDSLAIFNLLLSSDFLRAADVGGDCAPEWLHTRLSHS
jgi:quercetin dioxygenase-like cupin family protein